MDETAIIEEPPKLRSGNGSPVKGIKPTTVAIFIKILDIFILLRLKFAGIAKS